MSSIPGVLITIEDAEALRAHMRSINQTFAVMVGRFFDSAIKPNDAEKACKELDGLIDRLTIAIHEAKKS